MWYDTTPPASSGNVGGNVPIGGIIMYSGTDTELNALTNWKLCDGTTYGSANGGYAVYGNVAADDNRLYNCIIQATNLGCRYIGTVEGCAIVGTCYGTYQCTTVNRCVFYGIGLYGIFSTSYAHNNLLIGVASVPIWSTGTPGGHFINNTIIGGNVSTNVQNANGVATFWITFPIPSTKVWKNSKTDLTM